MISVFETVEVKAGQATAFEQAFEELAWKVRRAEPGNLLYQLYARPSEDRYTMLKIYRDEHDLEAHAHTQHARAASAQFSALLAAPPTQEILSCVV